MKPVFKSLIVAGLLATAGFAAYSQGPGGMGMMDHDGGGRMGHMGQRDPAKMEKMMAKHASDLKAKLKITPAQEGAWTAFTGAMKPPADMMAKRPDHAEMDKLSTPERIDKMRAMRNQHMTDMQANMDKRDESTKTFYATLTAEQKKVFDAEHARMRGGRHGDEHGKHGAKGGKDGKGAPAPAAPKQ
jgi:Spy/CpxP family protein refolding chaperone